MILTAPKTNSQRLAEIMSEWKLDVASIAALTLTSPDTVKSWLKPKTTKSHRSMADRHLHLLELKLGIHRHEGTRP